MLNPNAIDLSPPHAGILMGFCCGVSNLAGFVAPQGKVLNVTLDKYILSNGRLDYWRRVFRQGMGIGLVSHLIHNDCRRVDICTCC